MHWCSPPGVCLSRRENSVTLPAGRGSHSNPEPFAEPRPAGSEGIASTSANTPSELMGDAHLAHQPRIFEGLLLQPVIAAGSAAMSRAQVHLHQQRIAIRLERPQTRDVFGRLP